MDDYRDDGDDFLGFQLFQHVLHQQLRDVEVFRPATKLSGDSGLDLRHVVFVDEVEISEHLNHLVRVFVAEDGLEGFDLSIDLLEVVAR